MLAGEVSQLRQEKNELQALAALSQPPTTPSPGELDQWRAAAVQSSEEAALALERAQAAETRLAHAQQQLSRLASAYDGARRQLEELGHRHDH